MPTADLHEMRIHVHTLQKGGREYIKNTKHDSSRKGGEKIKQWEGKS